MNVEDSQEIIEVFDNIIQKKLDSLIKDKLKIYLDSDIGILTLFLEIEGYEEFIIPFEELIKPNTKKVVVQLLKEYLEDNED